MPQYLYNIDGQRHVFEGPDPRTTAQFAQRWAAAQASARAAAANDNRPQVGRRPSQFAMDIGARAKQDVADLTGAIDRAKAHPTDLLNGPRILSAVSRYVPNALGLAPAAGVDQVTGPVIRGINARFGTHFDPRYATDQILNGVGLLSGASEALRPEIPLAGADETSDVHPSSAGSGGSTARRVFPSAAGAPRVTAQGGEHPQFVKLKPNLTVAYTAPELHGHAMGRNSAGENVVPLSDGFVLNHQQRMKALEDLPEDIQDKYHSAIADRIIDPILDDPDYHGHNSAAVETIRRDLKAMADEQRESGGHPRLADALDAANEDFRHMVIEKQPEMARELGLTLPGGNTSGDPSTSQPDGDPTGPRATVLSFEQHVAPKNPYEGFDLDDFGEEIGDYLEAMQNKVGPEPVFNLMKLWRDINSPANDNFPPTNWAGRPISQKPLEFPFTDLDQMKSINELLPEHELREWMRSAANDHVPSSTQDWQQYIDELRSAAQVQAPPMANAPRAPLSLVWSAPQPSAPNAFSGATSGQENFDWASVPRAARQGSRLDFNALRPPRLLEPLMAGVANQGKNVPQPQN